MATTREILDNHLDRFMAGDLEGTLSDYAPDAIFFTPTGTLKGPGEIRPMFRALFDEFAKPGSAFNLRQVSVEGDYAFILWTAETADHIYSVATDTFTVRSGRIVAQSFMACLVPKH